MKIIDIVYEWIDSNREFLKELKQRQIVSQQAKYGPGEVYEKVHDNNKVCFVLSTGRSGTKLLTKIFGDHQNVLALHQPIPELIHFNKLAYQGFDSNDSELKSMIDIARYEYVRKAFLLNKHYVETNSGITFFAYQLASLYPNAKFIHLIREPVAFVQSGCSRGWYDNDSGFDEGRIQGSDGNRADWNDMSQVGKIAWLWNETNSFIHKFKESIPASRIMTVKSEELFGDSKVMGAIFKFLSLAPLEGQHVENLLSKKVNKQMNKTALTKAQVEEVQANTPIKENYYKS
ncbi:MAG: hypothetical protein COB85_05785 [Bacteroidetes bacterium]|nr:MAG: hypothetical protein COB85_05785 [Bacteroidota bacterium]